MSVDDRITLILNNANYLGIPWTPFMMPKGKRHRGLKDKVPGIFVSRDAAVPNCPPGAMWLPEPVDISIDVSTPIETRVLSTSLRQ